MAEKLTMAQTAAEAVSLKNADTVYLAGGTQINQLGSTIDAAHLISLKRVNELKKIEMEGDLIRIGAGCTFTEALESDLIPDYLKEALRFMVARTKRNMATLGGNIALLRSDSYIVPTLIAADAKVELMGADESTEVLCMEAYMQEHTEKKAALITAVLVSAEERRVLSKRYANTAESHAVLTISMGADKETLQNITITAAIKNGDIYSFPELAVTIEANPGITEEEILDWAYNCEEIAAADDMFGSAKYKRYLLGVTISMMLDELRKGGAR